MASITVPVFSAPSTPCIVKYLHDYQGPWSDCAAVFFHAGLFSLEPQDKQAQQYLLWNQGNSRASLFEMQQ